MWVQKSEEDIRQVLEARERRRKDLWRPFGFAAAMTVVIGIIYSLGVWVLYQGMIVVTFAPARFGTTTMVGAALLFVIIFVSSIRRQRRYGTLFPEREGFICADCKEPAQPNQDMRCGCGGRLEALDFFDWVSDAEMLEAGGEPVGYHNVRTE